MISRVKGTLVSRDTDRVELLAASGVVYEIHVPLTVFQRLPAEGSELELRTAYTVRDDTPSLYGFITGRERALFYRLMTVGKVGPRLAMALMSTYRASRLARGIAEEDSKLLSRVSGVGKKTAERIVLELSDKVTDLAASDDSLGPGAGQASEAVAALVALGYGFTDADRAVRDVLREHGTADTEQLIRLVLAERGGD